MLPTRLGDLHCPSASQLAHAPSSASHEEFSMAEIADVTDQSFESDVLNSPVPVVVDFWAEWCAPCRQIAPIVKELAGEYEGKVKIVKMNIDENPAAPGRYGVRAIPTLLAFQGGQVVEQLQGARPKSVLEEMVQKLI
jgi:thioredoxin 1